MTDTVTPRPRLIGKIVVAFTAVVFYAYPFWTALGNLINLPAYYNEQFGVSSAQVPWILLVGAVASPILVLVAAILTTWKRGAGAMALVLTAGFAVVNAIALSVLAFEKDVELRIVIDFLTGA
ncbi:MAG: hypothetical protein ACKOWN_00270 [Microbacteriaceae bacterium]